MSPAAWIAALRIARRDALRAKGRSLLVIVMIALPVLAVTAGDITYRSGSQTTAERLTRELGAADAVLSDAGTGGKEVLQLPDRSAYTPADTRPRAARPGGEPVPADLAAAVPRGAQTVRAQEVPVLARSAHGLVRTTLWELPAGDPMLRGRIELQEGRFARTRGEVVASTAFLDSAGLRIGSLTAFQGLDKQFRVVGSVELPGTLHEEAVFALPGSVIGPWRRAAEQDRRTVPPRPADPELFVALPPGSGGYDWQRVLAANKRGVLVNSRAVRLDPPPRSQVPAARRSHLDYDARFESRFVAVSVATVVAMALLEIVLLAGPAFAVGARRSRRHLGLIGVSGGDHHHIRAVVLGGGLVLGGAGALLGVAGGVAAVVAFQPAIESWTGVRFGTLEIRPLELLGIGALGVLTGAVAALAPAVVAGRQSVLESLTGRRGLRHSSRTLPMAGLTAILFGIVLALAGALTGLGFLAVAIGSVIAELGVLACIPLLVGALGRLGRRLPLIPRLALRDAARNRGRTAPAVAAVMAAVAGTVAIATYAASAEKESRAAYRPLLRAQSVALTTDLYQGPGDPAAALPRLRAAAERTLPVTGERADFSRVWAGADCLRNSAQPCGEVSIVRPEGQECPLEKKGAAELAARLTVDEHDRMMDSPRCRDNSRTLYGLDGSNGIVVGDAALLRSYAGLADPAAGRALAQGRPVLLNPADAKDGRTTLGITEDATEDEDGKRPPPERRVTVDAYVAPAGQPHVPGVRAVLPQSLADRLGLHTQAYGSFYRVGHTPSDVEEQRALAALDEAGGGAQLEVERGYSDRLGATLLVLGAFASVVTIGAAAIATGLAKADAEADLVTLSGVGAPPRVRRSLTGFQCAVVAGAGVVLGIAAGVVPAVALRLVDLTNAVTALKEQPLRSAYTPVVLPWGTLAALALGVPLFAGLLAAAVTRSRIVLPRRSG